MYHGPYFARHHDDVKIETPPCVVCGETSELYLTQAEFNALTLTREDGKPYYLIQQALPHRDSDFRELVMTGTHPECWAQLFPEEDDR